jgi:hypothetical protein
MPCQSYESSWANSSSDSEVRKLKKEADKLARIACRALQELEDNGIEDMLLLKDDETREWWLKHKEADRRAREKREAEERRQRMYNEALAKLSQEEREVLGIATKKHKKAAKITRDEDEILDELEQEFEKLYDQDGVSVYIDKRGDLHYNEYNDVEDDTPF